jgi:hypothetical protein
MNTVSVPKKQLTICNENEVIFNTASGRNIIGGREKILDNVKIDLEYRKRINVFNNRAKITWNSLGQLPVAHKKGLKHCML